MSAAASAREILTGLHEIMAKRGSAQSKLDRVAIGRSLQIPAGGKEFFARAGDDGDAQVRIVAEVAKDQSHLAAGGQIDGVRFRPVDDDFEDAVVASGTNGVLQLPLPPSSNESIRSNDAARFR